MGYHASVRLDPVMVQHELGKMPKEERESELLNIWEIDDEDSEFAI